MKTFCAILLLTLCACQAPSARLQRLVSESDIENPAWKPHAAYLAHVINATREKWERILVDSREYPRSGTDVAVTFRLGAQNGEVLEIVSVEGTADAHGQKYGVSAITAAAPFGAWSLEMQKDLGQSQELTFRFFYHE